MRISSCDEHWKNPGQKYTINCCKSLCPLEEVTMFWALSFELLPNEEIIDDTTRKVTSGVKPAYSVFLTNKRAVFRFDGLGSSMTQSFFYHEIETVSTSRRIFITYLELKTKKKNFLFHVADAPYWADKLLELKNRFSISGESRFSAAPLPDVRKREFMDMLIVLRKNSLLTEPEFEEKVRLLDSLKR